MSKAFADIGTDELMFWPALADLDQIDRVEDVLGQQGLAVREQQADSLFLTKETLLETIDDDQR